jgi:hypothetical protein
MPINLCSFEPGDGTVYRVLFGQVRQYTIGQLIGVSS